MNNGNQYGKFELYDIEETRKDFASYGVFDTYEEAYKVKIEKNHQLHALCGGNYYIKLDIKKIK